MKALFFFLSMFLGVHFISAEQSALDAAWELHWNDKNKEAISVLTNEIGKANSPVNALHLLIARSIFHLMEKDLESYQMDTFFISSLIQEDKECFEAFMLYYN